MANFTEKMQVAGTDLVERVKELVAEGNVRRIVIRNDKGKQLLAIPMNLSVAAGGVAVLAAPVLVVLGGIAGLLASVTVEVERTDVQVDDVIIVEVDDGD